MSVRDREPVQSNAVTMHMPLIQAARIAAGGLILALLAAPLGAREFKMETGQPFPTIYLPTLAGGELRSVASFRGKKLVLHIFASW